MWGNTGWKLNSILLGATKPQVFQGSLTFSRLKHKVANWLMDVANWLMDKDAGKISGTLENFDRASDHMTAQVIIGFDPQTPQAMNAITSKTRIIRPTTAAPSLETNNLCTAGT
jgi:hypothetical protein